MLHGHWISQTCLLTWILDKEYSPQKSPPGVWQHHQMHSCCSDPPSHSNIIIYICKHSNHVCQQDPSQRIQSAKYKSVCHLHNCSRVYNSTHTCICFFIQCQYLSTTKLMEGKVIKHLYPFNNTGKISASLAFLSPLTPKILHNCLDLIHLT